MNLLINTKYKFTSRTERAASRISTFDAIVVVH